jgi:hypothetical protein
VAEPSLCASERVCIERASMHPSVNGSADQTRALKYPQMPGNGRQRHRKRLRKLGDHRRLLRESCEQGASCAITERVKNGVEPILVRPLRSASA